MLQGLIQKFSDAKVGISTNNSPVTLDAMAQSRKLQVAKISLAG